MIRIFYTDYCRKTDEDTFQRHLGLLPLLTRENILRFKRWEDREASLYGKLLLIKGLQAFGVDASLADLRYTEYGRPYLAGLPDFNISHAGSLVICAISDECRIGIDIEKIRPVAIDEYRPQFSEDEWKDILGSADHLFRFYYYWTAKEAAAKANGKGFSLPFENFQVIDNGTIIEQTTWFITRISLHSDYMIQMASDCQIGTKIEPLRLTF